MTKLLEERQELFKEATEQIYDNIYELNITKNCAASRKTQLYFEALGAKDRLMNGVFAGSDGQADQRRVSGPVIFLRLVSINVKRPV